MPSFNFSINKKVNKKTIINKDNIIIKDVQGVVWIKEDGTYYINVSEKKAKGLYNIHPKCYSCKGHNTLYRRCVPIKQRYIYIKSSDSYSQQSNYFFLPFDVGCTVIGDIIKNNITSVYFFVIKKCFIDFTNDESKNAILFYKEHINKINEIIKNKLLNDI